MFLTDASEFLTFDRGMLLFDDPDDWAGAPDEFIVSLRYTCHVADELKLLSAA